MKEIPRYSEQEIDAVIPDKGIDPKVKIKWRPPDYTTSNVTTDRTFDADATTLAELSDIVGTLIADLIEAGILK